ncbi:biotin transporter BioY [Mycoplasmatota bacterium]|nr:biotin transporter BioY [Mycoplasmatota bacterium]
MTNVVIFPTLMIATAGFTITLVGAPITLQTLFVLLSGMVLGARLGFISMVLYILLGLIGLPVFANFQGGYGVIFGPSGGFILSFPIASLVAGLLTKYDNKYSYIISSLAATFIIYLIGIPWMAYILGWRLTETIGYMTVYFPGDVGKIILAILISNRLIRHNVIQT